MEWIGVDLDGTLAHLGTGAWDGSIGKPIEAMVDEVHILLAAGYEVKIFTARVAPCNCGHASEGAFSINEQARLIKAWCVEQFGRELDVTATKDYHCIAIYDDRAFSVQRNTGKVIGYGDDPVSKTPYMG